GLHQVAQKLTTTQRPRSAARSYGRPSTVVPVNAGYSAVSSTTPGSSKAGGASSAAGDGELPAVAGAGVSLPQAHSVASRASARLGERLVSLRGNGGRGSRRGDVARRAAAGAGRRARRWRPGPARPRGTAATPRRPGCARRRPRTARRG